MDNKLLEIVATGKSKHYFGKKYTAEEIKGLGEEDREALYEGYKLIEQSELAMAMKDTFVAGVGELSCALFGIKNKDGVIEDLKNDPFTEKFVGVVTSSLYGSLGWMIAPISFGAIITKHKLKERYDGTGSASTVSADGDDVTNSVDSANYATQLYSDANGNQFYYDSNGQAVQYIQDVVNKTLESL